MPTTNFPGGASSYGIPLFGAGSVYDMPWGNSWFVCNRSTHHPWRRDEQGSRDALARRRTRARLSVRHDLRRTWARRERHGVHGVQRHRRVWSEHRRPGHPPGRAHHRRGRWHQPADVHADRRGLHDRAGSGRLDLENIRILCPQTGTTTTTAMVAVTAAGCMQCGSASSRARLRDGARTTCISALVGRERLSGAGEHGLHGHRGPTAWLSTTGTIAAGSRVISAQH
jgi:hypothetical protein